MRISDWSSDVCSADRLFRHLEIQDEQGLLGFGLPIYQHPMESNLTLAAQMLRDAYQGPPIAPMRRFLDPLDVEGAYAVQALNTRHWLAEGRVLVGRKVGLTAKAVQQQKIGRASSRERVCPYV